MRGQPAETATGTSPSYASLLNGLRALSRARTIGEALNTAFLFLHEQHTLRAMMFEQTTGSGTQMQPYGDMQALILAQEPDSAVASHCCFLDEAEPALGKLTFLFDRHTQCDIGLLELITTQVGARLNEETLAKKAEDAETSALQRINEVAAIYEIGQAVDQIELSSLLDLITFRAAKLLEAHVCSLMMVNPQTGSLHVEASFGLDEAAQHAERRLGEGIAGRVAVTEQPILIVGALNSSLLEDAETRNFVSSMLVPLKSQEGKVFGVLSARRNRPAAEFTNDDLKLFSVFGAQAALAVTNVRLYEDLKRRAEELLKISTLSRVFTSTLDIDELLKRIADNIRTVVGFERCCLYMKDGRKPLYIPTVWHGYSDSIARNPVKEGEGAVGAAARTKITQFFDARDVPPAEPQRRAYMQLKGFARSLGAEAFVAIPIITRHNRCIGVVVADNRGKRAPISPEQISLLTAFVYQAGIALENARLYEEMQENYKNTQRLKNYIDNVFQSIGAGIVSIDADGRIVRWNRVAEETLEILGGYKPHLALPDIIGRMHLPEAERSRLRQIVELAQVAEESIHLHKFTLHPRGRAPLSINLILSRLMDHNAERAGVVMIFEDVTQEVQLEAEVEKMRRLADIGQLAAKMAHEVRNALSPIKGAAQIIRVELESQNTATEWPDIIIAEVDNLSRLTSEMLDFARPLPINPQPLDVSEFLYSAVQSLATFLSELETRVHWQIPLGLPELEADPVYLGQVVRNIVMNAAQAMPDGGDLFIDATADTTRGVLLLRFRDTGIGIPDEELDRIFRPFVTTKTKGTGLGLPIVQKIVDHHGGNVSVTSRVGAGTCFTVVLPLRPTWERPDVKMGQAPVVGNRPHSPIPDR